jgi:hypothetical protein
MSAEQRERFNEGRRRRYGRKRLRMGLSYEPKIGKAPQVEEDLGLPTLTAEEALTILLRIQKEEEDAE